MKAARSIQVVAHIPPAAEEEAVAAAHIRLAGEHNTQQAVEGAVVALETTIPKACAGRAPRVVVRVGGPSLEVEDHEDRRPMVAVLLSRCM
ncbi:hypothetical protein Acry_3176 (plasmid) [Acidiphilium cryptum JF-5]|uniref:Uncharacterized protein n=1 Tax=Acidiphilium cryptum (strain JF-5) TaxID=349163 RepID=A5FT67_ACICJ|nr:hypothetical protein Acry_3176 [Acidiphilium cryptum JF-5]